MLFKKIIYLFFIAAPLVGCNTTSNSDFSTGQVGRSEQSVIERWGIPTSKHSTQNGVTILQYQHRATRQYCDASPYPAPACYKHKCVATFEIENSTVTDFRMTGDNTSICRYDSLGRLVQ